MSETETVEIKKVRTASGVSIRLFSRLSGYSERAIGQWERGKAPTESTRLRLKEVTRLLRALSKVMEKEAIVPWLQTPNSAFDDLKPIEVVDRGEIDRLWRMIFHLESGVPA